MKHYHLINAMELKQLSQQLLDNLQLWNFEYSLNPIALELNTVGKKEVLQSSKHIIDDSYQPLALLTDGFVSLLNYSLFNEDEPFFTSVSEELISHLINQLLKTQASRLIESYSIPNWIYPGTSCLKLTLKCGHYEQSCFLNPNWVHQRLPLNKNSRSKLTSLEEVLKEEFIVLNSDLLPVPIPLNQLLDIQVGDVLLTDHKQNTPIQLKHEAKTFALAELGKNLESKSLVIKEFI